MQEFYTKKEIIMNKFNSPEYKRSRNAYTVQCALEYFVSLLVADAFLAKLLTHLGISDALVGIISSFVTLAFVFQLLSIFLVKLKVSTKKLVTAIDVASVFFFMLLYFVPFLPVGGCTKTALVIISVFCAYAAKYLVLSVYYKWGNSFVEPTKRGSFSATKEIISLLSGMAFTAVMGYIIDRYESIGNIEGGFLFIAISVLILNICNLICLVMIKKEDAAEHEAERVPLKEVLSNTLGNKNFRSIIILTVLWETARYFTVGFMGVYKTNDLMMSVLLIQVVNIIGNFVRALISTPIGKYSDKTSYAKGLKLGLWIAAAAFFLNMFTAKTTWFMVIIYTILYDCSQAGTNQNSFNITYSYVDSKYVTQAMAFKNSIGGICGFVASLAGGKLVSVIQAKGNMIFGLHIYAQQILSAISLIIVLIAIVYTAKVIEKQKIMIQ